MAITALLSEAIRPTEFLADKRIKVDIEQLIPSEFGDWQLLKQSSGLIVNPQQSLLVKKLYTQTLSRTYINPNGKIVMLSIAYGANQSDSVALHYPEVCYPAQGFQVQTVNHIELVTSHGNIDGKQLMTKLGNRNEPITYWATLGDKVVRGGIPTKLAQLAYGIKGFIPDGLIFRVSSINNDAKAGFEDHIAFIRDLMDALPSSSRLRIAGLTN